MIDKAAMRIDKPPPKMSEVDKLLAGNKTYTDHNGVSFQLLLTYQITHRDVFLINCFSRVPSTFLAHVSNQMFYYYRNRPGSDTGSNRPLQALGVTGQVPNLAEENHREVFSLFPPPNDLSHRKMDRSTPSSTSRSSRRATSSVPTKLETTKALNTMLFLWLQESMSYKRS